MVPWPPEWAQLFGSMVLVMSAMSCSCMVLLGPEIETVGELLLPADWPGLGVPMFVPLAASEFGPVYGWALGSAGRNGLLEARSSVRKMSVACGGLKFWTGITRSATG